jgi:hypothetical protein
VSYNPRELPDEGDVGELRQWLREELRILSKSLNETTEVDLRASKSAPTRPREGMIVHADGNAWNPGSGAGTYRFQNGLWVKVPSGASDIGSLWGPARSLGLSATPTTLTVAQSGMSVVNFNANRTLNFPTPVGNPGVCYSFFTLDGGGGGNLTISTPAGSFLFPNGASGASATFPSTGRGSVVSDGSNWLVFGTNFAGAVVGNGLASDLTSLRTVQQMSVTVDGSGLKLSGDVGSPGASQLYGTDGGGTKGWFAQPTGGGLTLVTTASFPASPTWAITGLGGYKFLVFALTGVQQASGTSRIFQAELSGNNGSSYGGIKQPFGAVSIISSGNVLGFFNVTRTDQTNNQVVFQQGVLTNATIANFQETGSIGPINAIRFSWSGAATNFTAGVVDVYGLK